MTLYTAGLDATDWQLLRSRWRWLLGAGILLALVALVALFYMLPKRVDQQHLQNVRRSVYLKLTLEAVVAHIHYTMT